MKIKAIYLKAGHTLPPDVIEIDENITNCVLKEILNCEQVQASIKFFGGKRYTIFHDYFGWYNSKRIATAYMHEKRKKISKLSPALFGSLIICGYPKKENPSSLGLRDIVNILKHGIKIDDHYAFILKERLGFDSYGN